MLSVRPADDRRRRRWQDGLRMRLEDRWGPIGAGANVPTRMAGWGRAAGSEIGLLLDEATEVGHVALAHYLGAEYGMFDNAVVFFDLWIEPAHRGRGYGHAARAHGEAWGRARGAAVAAAAIWADDPGLHRLFADYPLRSQRMSKALTAAPDLGGAGWSYRPLRPGPEYDEWLQRDLHSYAADLSDSGSLPMHQAMSEAQRSHQELLPKGPDTADHAIWVVEVDGEPVADLWLRHRMAPGVSFVYGVQVRPTWRGRGYGRAAMLLAEDRTLSAGDAFLGLNVFGHNRVAINLYTSLGYVLVDSTRSVTLN